MSDDPKSVLEEFKEVTRDVDVQTRIHLGIAYRDMGLYADAIQEFEQVLEFDANHNKARVLLIETKALMESGPPSG